MEISTNDMAYLLKATTTNSAVLFLGAGFSVDAVNKLGISIPLGADFARILWNFMGYSGDYDFTDLPILFEAAAKKKKHLEVKKLVEDCYFCTKVPEWYATVARIFWRRVYTTNIDDLLERIYSATGAIQKLEVINALKDDFRERDQFLRRLQYVKLNGTLPYEKNGITFSVQQYAHRMNQREPWYDHFVRDYSTYTTIFIGSRMIEPLLSQALAARASRFPDRGEMRPRAFLVCPSISPAQIDALNEYKVTPVLGDAKEFFALIADSLKVFPGREDVIVATNPDLKEMLELISSHPKAHSIDLQEFYRCFSPVKRPQVVPQTRKLFLQGAEPTWSDIYNNLDAPRDFTSHIVRLAMEEQSSKGASLIAISGSAGSGKSTLLRRVALALSEEGSLVFFTTSEELPLKHQFAGALQVLPKRPVIVFDNVSLSIGRLMEYLDVCRRGGLEATFIVAGRTSKLIERIPELKQLVEVSERHMPDLSISDIDSIIEMLDKHTQLGRLANKPLHEQRDIFKKYAHYQLLVAMRWATLGRGFDAIITDEFLTTEPLNAKMIYLCACLATAAQFTLSKQQLLASSTAKPAEALAYIRYNLKDVVIPVDIQGDRFAARHRAIADLVADHIAPREMLRNAYISLLKVLSHDLSYPVDTTSRTFRLYQRLINHASIHRRFSSHINFARDIYEALAAYLKDDYHYLLQYGSLELEYGELDIAANYIEQAYAMTPEDNLVINTRGYLFYKQACNVNMRETADLLRADAREILLKQVSLSPKGIYAKHMLCSQELNWINHWIHNSSDRKRYLTDLREFAQKVAKEHSSSGELQEVFKRVSDAYLESAVSPSS